MRLDRERIGVAIDMNHDACSESPLTPALTRPELWVPAMIEQRDLSSVYAHWSRMWMDMPALLYRLAWFLSQAVMVDGSPVIESCIVAGGMVIRQWEMDGNSRRIIRRGVRALFERAMDAATVEVLMGGSPWLPLTQGPLSPLLIEQPRRSVELRVRPERAVRRAQLELSAALGRHVYGPACIRTLHCDFLELMESE